MGHAFGIVYTVARDCEAFIVWRLCLAYAQISFWCISNSSTRFDRDKMKLEGHYARKLQGAYLNKRSLSQSVSILEVEACSPPRKTPRFKSFLSESLEGEGGSTHIDVHTHSIINACVSVSVCRYRNIGGRRVTG